MVGVREHLDDQLPGSRPAWCRMHAVEGWGVQVSGEVDGLG